MRHLIWPILLFAFHTQAAVFGPDDRFLISSQKEDAIARATAVGVLTTMITPSSSTPGTYSLSTSELDSVLCPDQKFHSLPSVDYACSGFLIAPDILVTAGHCAVNFGEIRHETDMYCDAYGWLFGYQVDAQGNVQKENIPAENYYTCQEIIYAVNGTVDGKTKDFAVIRLDRPVVNRAPIPLSSQPAKVGDPVSMIGYPLGAPVIYSGNAQVININPLGDSWITNLDAFDGNSGSAVLNSKKEVVGILIAGTPESFLDTPRKGGGSCYRYNTCDTLGKSCASMQGILNPLIPVGSEIQNIAPVISILQDRQKN